MEKDLIDAVAKAIGSTRVKEALVFQDYEDVMSIIDELMEEFTVTDRFLLFDMLYAAIKENDYKKVTEVIIKCETMFKLSLAAQVVSHYDAVAKEMEIANGEEEENKENESLILRLDELKMINYDVFAKDFLDKKDEPFDIVKSINDVFSLTVIGCEVDKVLSQHLEALIDGNEITCMDVMVSVLNREPIELMRKVMLMRALREKFYDVKSIEIMFLNEKINRMLSIGLKREKPTE